jgi:hypothetical protein
MLVSCARRFYNPLTDRATMGSDFSATAPKASDSVGFGGAHKTIPDAGMRLIRDSTFVEPFGGLGRARFVVGRIASIDRSFERRAGEDLAWAMAATCRSPGASRDSLRSLAQETGVSHCLVLGVRLRAAFRRRRQIAAAR